MFNLQTCANLLTFVVSCLLLVWATECVCTQVNEMSQHLISCLSYCMHVYEASSRCKSPDFSLLFGLHFILTVWSMFTHLTVSLPHPDQRNGSLPVHGSSTIKSGSINHYCFCRALGRSFARAWHLSWLAGQGFFPTFKLTSISLSQH